MEERTNEASKAYQEQIIGVLKEQEAGAKAADLARLGETGQICQKRAGKTAPG